MFVLSFCGFWLSSVSPRQTKQRTTISDNYLTVLNQLCLLAIPCDLAAPIPIRHVRNVCAHRRVVSLHRSLHGGLASAYRFHESFDVQIRRVTDNVIVLVGQRPRAGARSPGLVDADDILFLSELLLQGLRPGRHHPTVVIERVIGIKPHLYFVDLDSTLSSHDVGAESLDRGIEGERDVVTEVRILKQSIDYVRHLSLGVDLLPAIAAAISDGALGSRLAHKEVHSVEMVNHQVSLQTAGVVPIATPAEVPLGIERALR